MDSSPDQTMQSLLGVHRFEVSELEDKVNQLESLLSDVQHRERTASTKVSHLVKDAEARRERQQKADAEHAERIEKLHGVVDALKLDLGNEREAHTGLQDTVREHRKHLDAAITELVTHGDLTPTGKRVLRAILGGDDR